MNNLADLEMRGPRDLNPEPRREKAPPPPAKLVEYRKPNKDEQLEAFHNVFTELHFHRTYTGNKQAAEDILLGVEVFAEAHKLGDPKDRQSKINRAFWERMTKTPELGRKK